MRKITVLFVLVLLTFTAGNKPVPIIPSASVDIYPEPFNNPVNFGHVYRAGFSDGVEDRDPRDIPNPQDRVQVRIKEPPKPGAVFASPRDQYDYYRKYGNPEFPNSEPKSEKGRERMWFDFAGLLQRNMARPPEPSRRKVVLPKKMQAPVLGEKEAPQEVETGKHVYLSPDSFGLDDGNDNDRLNWTTCDEFKVGAKFHPSDVLDKKWLPFYVWSMALLPAAYLHEFRRPTQKLVWEYKEKYGRYLDKRIDWEQPKLVMRHMTEFLLIAGDQRGSFYMITDIHIPEHVRDTDMVLPLMSLRLKRQKKYLLMMSCNEIVRYIAAMAAEDEYPTIDIEKVKIAQSFHIRGYGQPVARDLNREADLYRRKNIYLARQNRNSTMIRTSQDFGMFPPERRV